MTYDLKTASEDTTVDGDAFVFGADSQAATDPSIYKVSKIKDYILGLANTWTQNQTFSGGVNKVTITAPATGSTLTIADGKTLTANNTLTLAGTDSTTMTFPSTSATLARTDAANSFTGNQTLESTAELLWSTDLRLTRRGAANLRLGAADAASPVAQTLSVQSVVAGTTNTAGTNLTITGSQGTGTGAGGSIIFQVAPAGSSGTAQNASVNALTINSSRQIVATIAGTAAAPAFCFNNSAGTGFHLSSTNNGFGFSIPAGSPVFEADFNSGVKVLRDMYIGWSNNNVSSLATIDVRLHRDTSNTLALRNGTNAQESRVYGSFTATDNFQRMSIKTLRESSGALSGASYTTTIAIPAYAVPVGVTTRVTTAITGATSYDVGDGTDVDLWGDNIGITLGSQSRTADFTAIAAVDAAATARTVTLTAVGSNFTGGVVEICVHYLTTEAD